jgi:peptidoglycan/LPS O-acetylase OafA/YrhL
MPHDIALEDHVVAGHQNIKIDYRSEIDGLRAVAVVPVILFHAGFEQFSGGFAGVDVFFVISGYLITSLILADLENGRFSILDFYERRARRILPALFLVVVACMPLAWIWLPPQDLESFWKNVVAVAVFGSNVQLWRESGYFDTAVELKPLLHTWSLAVEEQFYLLFPAFLMLTWRLGKKWIAALLVAGCAASLATAHWGAVHRPAAAFFLLPTRGWELALGALVALYLARKGFKERPDLTDEILTLTGLALIAWSVFSYSKATPYPGLYALAPTIGTALVIVYGSAGTYAGKFLGGPGPVGIGLISYSAYLWHQPIFAFARHRSLAEPNALVYFCLFVVTFGLAYLSWKFVERPFRFSRTFQRHHIFALAGGGSLLLGGIGMWGVLSETAAHRNVTRHLPENYIAQSWIKHGAVESIDGNECVSEKASICRLTRRPGSKKILLVGDSHSADFTTEFKNFVVAESLDAWQMSVGGCGFISYQFQRNDGECGKARGLLGKVIQEERFDTVLFVVAIGGHLAELPDSEVKTAITSHTGLLKTMLENGVHLIYFTTRPTFNYSPTKAAILDRLSEVHVVGNATEARLDHGLAGLKRVDGFTVFDQSGALLEAGCGKLECFNGHATNGMPIYRDTNHLTTLGASIVFAKLKLMLRGMQTP